MRSYRLFCLITLLLVFRLDLQAEQTEPKPEKKIYKDISYVSGGHERQKLDLYIPKGRGPFPLLVWVHGGAWRAGSKERPRGLEWLDRGVALASLNYRLSHQATFPAQIEDCKSAIRWLRAHAEKYELDSDRVIAWGASAGGHLVALLGVTGDIRSFDVGGNLDQSSSVTAVIDEYGPTDFLQMDAMDGQIGRIHHNAEDSPESQLIGGPIQEHPERVKSANPITYVTEKDAPFLIIHGDEDPLVAHGQSVILLEALNHAGVLASFYTVKGGKHGWFKDLQVSQRIEGFLVEHFGLSHGVRD